MQSSVSYYSLLNQYQYEFILHIQEHEINLSEQKISKSKKIEFSCFMNDW